MAEARGYTHVRIIKSIDGSPDIGIGHHPTEPHSVPDYLGDLNACHQMEQVLTDDQRWEQVKIIVGYRQAANGFPMLSRSEALRLQSATAAQRCEAFLRTLGLWQPTPTQPQ